MTLTSRRVRAFLSAVAVAALTAGLLVAYGQFRSEPDQPGIEARGPKTTQPPAAAATPTATPDADAGESADELNQEAEEQAESTEKRHEAFEKAKAAGKTGQQRPTGAAAAAPAAGWAGELPWTPSGRRLGAGDRGRPELAVRLRARHPLRRAQAVPGQLPVAVMALEISPDGGATWGGAKPLCACKGSGQFDPIIEVVPQHRQRLRALHERLQRDVHEVDRPRRDWSAPVKTYGNVSGTTSRSSR